MCSETKRETLCPGREKFIEDAKKLKPATFRSLVARRARQVVSPKITLPSEEEERRSLEGKIKEFYEKINTENNLLPASFLTDGAGRANAVCRMVTPKNNQIFYGTGFLIARGYLMTNNHVLETSEDARIAVAEFGFQDGHNIRRISLDPDRLFITDKDLDFTIVACDDRLISDIEPISLLRNPALVTRYERVNIIQHPGGRPKQIALHDNKVKEVLDKVIHYETDTEPGSSGSPVFNNDWELVGLHHAGWKEDGGKATNEGIRISAIVSHLLGESISSSTDAEALSTVLGNAGTLPHLGFFDYSGIGEPGSLEVEVDDIQGSPNFADIGFWNIEHLNNSVSNQRIDDVAGVVGRLSMDVLGLTEVQKGALDRLVTVLGRQGFSMEHRILDVSGSQDIAVLYDRDTTTVTLNDDIPRRNTERLNAKTLSRKTAFPRRPLFAECRVGEGNGEVRFLLIVVHLKAFGDQQSRQRRKLAAKMLSEIIEDIRENENIPVVLGGDFNERLNNNVLSSLKDSPDLFAMTADDAATNAISYVGGRHRSLIDHIIVSRDVRAGDISGDDAAIVRLDRSVRDFSDRISDHVPVVFRMVYRRDGIDLDPQVPSSDMEIPIPDGVANLRLSFEN